MSDSKKQSDMDITKATIFDMFYQKQTVSRSGGGTQRKKMSRIAVSAEDMDSMEKRLSGNKKLLEYFKKLRDRKPGIAPPPYPSLT